MIIQKNFRTSKALSDDFSEICSRNGLSDSACLNRLLFLYCQNDTLLQSRVSDVTLVQQFHDLYAE